MILFRKHQTLQLPASACALGMFDGVHLGHRMVLENAVRQAHILNVPSVVFSFADHPQKLLSDTPTQLLSTLDERLEQFEQLGFDYALILDFTPELKNLSPQDFISHILVDSLHARHVTVGYDHRFGKNRSGNGELLTELGRQAGFAVDIIEPVRVNDVGVQGQIASSTLIRKLLSYGDVQQANALLGRPYALSGRVVTGFQRGRQIGFPTANLVIEPNRIVPAVGIYGGFALLHPSAGDGQQLYPAVCNVGHSPTFNNGDAACDKPTPAPRIEVHLLDYTGPSFYDEFLTMQFTDHLREEVKFSSVDALITQIYADCQTFRERLSQALTKTTH